MSHAQGSISHGLTSRLSSISQIGVVLGCLFLVLPRVTRDAIPSLMLLNDEKGLLCSCPTSTVKYDLVTGDRLSTAGRLSYLEGDLGASADSLGRLANTSKRLSLARLTQGDVAFAQGNEDAAVDLWKQGGAGLYLVGRARGYASQMQTEQAAKWYVLASVVNPASPIVDEAIIYIHSLNDRSGMRLLLQRVAQASGIGSAMGLRIQGQLALLEGDYERAEALLLHSVELNSADAEAHNQLGYAAQRLGQFSIAERAYLDAVNLAPADPNYYGSLGYLYESHRQIEDAVRLFAKATQLGGYWGYWDALAEAYSRLGRVGEAAVACGQADEMAQGREAELKCLQH